MTLFCLLFLILFAFSSFFPLLSASAETHFLGHIPAGAVTSLLSETLQPRPAPHSENADSETISEPERSLENLSVPTVLPPPSCCRLVVFIYAFLEAAGPTKLIIVSDFFPAALLSSA